MCLCAYVEPRETRTRLLLLQHPRERRVPVNTLRIAALCLPAATVRVGVDFAEDLVVARHLSDNARPAVLLFPGEAARDLRHDPPTGDVTLVVIDGTWWQAERVLKSNPTLAGLPRYGFNPSQPGRYRIRREPAEHCVATIEALAEALTLLDGDTGVAEALLKPFDVMVERQLAYAAREGNGRKRTRRVSVSRGRPTPAVLREHPDSVVLVYGEANAWPYGAPGAPPHEIVHWVAERLTTGERLEAMVAPRYPLGAGFEHHTGIPPEVARAGESLEDLRMRWAQFVKPGDVLGTWGVYAADVLDSQGVPLGPRVDLRTAMAVYLASRAGALEDCPQRLGVAMTVPWARGRAGLRLAALRAVAQVLSAGVDRKA